MMKKRFKNKINCETKKNKNLFYERNFAVKYHKYYTQCVLHIH